RRRTCITTCTACLRREAACCLRATTGQSVSTRLPEPADPPIGRAWAPSFLASVTGTRLDRGPKPDHRVPVGRWEHGATASSRGGAGRAQGGHYRCAGWDGCARGKECHEHYSHCHDVPGLSR